MNKFFFFEEFYGNGDEEIVKKSLIIYIFENVFKNLMIFIYYFKCINCFEFLFSSIYLKLLCCCVLKFLFEFIKLYRLM